MRYRSVTIDTELGKAWWRRLSVVDPFNHLWFLIWMQRMGCHSQVSRTPWIRKAIVVSKVNCPLKVIAGSRPADIAAWKHYETNRTQAGASEICLGSLSFGSRESNWVPKQSFRLETKITSAKHRKTTTWLLKGITAVRITNQATIRGVRQFAEGATRLWSRIDWNALNEAELLQVAQTDPRGRTRQKALEGRLLSLTEIRGKVRRIKICFAAWDLREEKKRWAPED